MRTLQIEPTQFELSVFDCGLDNDDTITVIIEGLGSDYTRNKIELKLDKNKSTKLAKWFEGLSKEFK